MKIEKNVPIPHGRRTGHREEFHEFLEFCLKASIGDSVVVKNHASNYRMAMLIAQVWLKKTFTASPNTATRKNPEARIWRIK